MKRILVGSCMVALFAGMVVADTVTSVNVVGYYNLTIAGDAVADQYTLLSVPMTRMPVDRGLVAANTASSITVNNAGWTPGQFTPPADWTSGNEAQEETFFVEVTSGAFEGRHFYIAGNTADTLTLAAAVADLNANDLAGATYKIVPATRIRDVFGTPGGTVALNGGSTAANSDNATFWTLSGWSQSIYYKNAGPGVQNRWRQGATTVDDMPIDRDEGILVKRLPATGNAILTVAGEVSGNIQSIPIEQGYSLQNGMVAVDTPINQSGLDTILKGGTTASAADNILEWDPSEGWLQSVYYKNGGPGGIGWRRGSTDVSATFVLKAGNAYLFKVSDPIVWDRLSPLN